MIGGGTRFYRVSAINSAGIGQQSSVASATTELCGGYKSLSTAITSGDVEGVQCLIEELGEDVNATDDGTPMLFWAILEENPDIVRLLVEAGADVNATDANVGISMLPSAINVGKSDIVRLLVDAGADVDATDDRGKPMLYWAIPGGNPEIVRILMEAGAK